MLVLHILHASEQYKNTSDFSYFEN